MKNYFIRVLCAWRHGESQTWRQGIGPVGESGQALVDMRYNILDSVFPGVCAVDFRRNVSHDQSQLYMGPEAVGRGEIVILRKS